MVPDLSNTIWADCSDFGSSDSEGGLQPPIWPDRQSLHEDLFSLTKSIKALIAFGSTEEYIWSVYIHPMALRILFLYFLPMVMGFSRRLSLEACLFLRICK